jgi:hypothetical protein
MFVSTVRGGAVCELDDREDAPLASADAVRSSEWITRIIGDDYREAPAPAASAQVSVPPESPAGPEPVADSAGPGAAVIPLPPPLWSGLIGLGSLLAGSTARRIRRLL